MNRTRGTSEAAGPAYDSWRWLALAVLLLAAAIDLIDVTVVNIALPAIREHLGASAAQLQWIIAGCTLAFALTLIRGGRLGDVHGRRRVFLVGVAGFTLASLACGLAWSADALVAARVIQGAFAGLMVPQVLSTINVSFSPEERRKAHGLYGAVAGIATVSGPLAAGLLVQGDLFGLDWRPIFLINLPVGLVTFAAALAFVRESRESDAPRLDLTGVGLVTAALLLLLFPLVQGALLAAVEHAGDAFSSWWLVPALLLSGLAMGMVAPTLVDVTLAGVHGRDAGSASGVLNTALQLGGAIGVALIGVVYFGALDEQGFIGALDDALWFQVGVFVVSALAMLLLPRRASADRDEAAVHATPAAAESC